MVFRSCDCVLLCFVFFRGWNFSQNKILGGSMQNKTDKSNAALDEIGRRTQSPIHSNGFSVA